MAYKREKGDVIQGCAIITRLLLLFVCLCLIQNIGKYIVDAVKMGICRGFLKGLYVLHM